MGVSPLQVAPRAVERWGRVEPHDWRQQCGSSSTLCLHSHDWLPGRAKGRRAPLHPTPAGGGGVQRSRERQRGGGDGW